MAARGRHRRRYIDVNVFVYWLGGHPQFGRQALHWIEKAENASPKSFITATLTLYETIVILAGLSNTNLRDEQFIRDVMKALTSLKGLAFVPLEANDYLRALTLMRKHSLDLEDSLHLTIALKTSSSKIISNDQDFDRTPLNRVF